MVSRSSLQHKIEIQQNIEYWRKKPALQKIYKHFYSQIRKEINFNIKGKIVELGSGIGNLKSVVPETICTDLFDNPWLDQKENAYCLTFPDESVSNFILFDVFHHLEYPGTALDEFCRVLKNRGRVIIFEPTVSILGLVVYGLFHHEPLGLFKEIDWYTPEDFNPNKVSYYAAQSNAWKIFKQEKYQIKLSHWKIIKKKTYSSLAYILSGGYSKPQMFPDALLPFISMTDEFLSKFKLIFGTRLLLVLEKISLKK